MTIEDNETFFAPQLIIPAGIADISFYLNAFGAKEVRSWRNADNSIHVAELSVNGAIFQLHEEKTAKLQIEPVKANGVTALIGLFVENVDIVINNALKAGAKLLSPVQDYEYGYRQGYIRDPFGHQWIIESKIIEKAS